MARSRLWPLAWAAIAMIVLIVTVILTGPAMEVVGRTLVRA